MANYLLGLYEKSMPNSLSIIEKLQEAKVAGYDYLEISIDETDEKLARLRWSDEEIAKINQVGRETGISIKSICLSGHRKYPFGSPDTRVRERSLEIMEESIKFAVKLGIRVIQIAGYDVYYQKGNEQTKELFSKSLELAVKMAAKEGVVLGFETMETPFMDTVEKAMYWVDKIKSPYLQVYPDVGNMTNSSLLYGGDVVEDLRLGKGHMVAVHLKETKPGAYREVPYGTGHVDFGGVIKEALAQRVGMFLCEFWYVGNEDWKKVLKENNLFLRESLDEVC
jgi:predicted hexulose-6-phosphate isomerase